MFKMQTMQNKVYIEIFLTDIYCTKCKTYYCPPPQREVGQSIRSSVTLLLALSQINFSMDFDEIYIKRLP